MQKMLSYFERLRSYATQKYWDMRHSVRTKFTRHRSPKPRKQNYNYSHEQLCSQANHHPLQYKVTTYQEVGNELRKKISRAVSHILGEPIYGSDKKIHDIFVDIYDHEDELNSEDYVKKLINKLKQHFQTISKGENYVLFSKAAPILDSFEIDLVNYIQETKPEPVKKATKEFDSLDALRICVCYRMRLQQLIVEHNLPFIFMNKCSIQDQSLRGVKKKLLNHHGNGDEDELERLYRELMLTYLDEEKKITEETAMKFIDLMQHVFDVFSADGEYCMNLIFRAFREDMKKFFTMYAVKDDHKDDHKDDLKDDHKDKTKAEGLTRELQRKFNIFCKMSLCYKNQLQKVREELLEKKRKKILENENKGGRRKRATQRKKTRKL